MSVRIGQASLGETGAHGQKPGNQTGRELNFAYWYSGSWLGVLRFKDRRKAELAAQACEAGVGNKNIGYDQDGRNTAYVAAEAVDFILSKIAKPVETDCSAFMMLCAISAGVDALKETYRKQGNSCTTYCMMRCFPATGEFELLTDRKYLTSDAYLRRGDILVSSGHNVISCVCIASCCAGAFLYFETNCPEVRGGSPGCRSPPSPVSVTHPPNTETEVYL